MQVPSLGWEDPLGEGHGNSLQYSCPENPMGRGIWWATVHGVAKSQTWLSNWAGRHECLPLGCMKYRICRHPFIITKTHQFSSVTQSCLTLCDPMDCSTPGFPVHHQLPENTQTHVHWVGDAIQPSHPLSSPSPPAFSLSHHQGKSFPHPFSKTHSVSLKCV